MRKFRIAICAKKHSPHITLYIIFCNKSIIIPVFYGNYFLRTGGSTPLLCLEGVPDLPVAPQDEAGLTKTFQTWPRGWFHIP